MAGSAFECGGQMSITLAGYSLEVTGVRNQCLGFERFVKPLKTLAGYSLEVTGVRNLGLVLNTFPNHSKPLLVRAWNLQVFET
ncbi:hypothetical protein COR50_15585 [Chitinophaga caeni]|uniref:Uncharacterized protein n=1 Tax=Chitinophaga caeni TaxID=2029983 RepID=A0A291QWY1_9BACT|nr:hypothetical protein COR50_15585 [Chitinophaga caeni]